jgi:hypothetical protein
MVKTKDQLDDNEVINLMSSVISYNLPSWNINHERANEIIELLDLESSEMRRIKRLTSDRNKNRALASAIHKKIINTKEWNVRSVEFAKKVCQMITSYIENGNEESLKNFILFKMMTHSKHPIYGMEE